MHCVLCSSIPLRLLWHCTQRLYIIWYFVLLSHYSPVHEQYALRTFKHKHPSRHSISPLHTSSLLNQVHSAPPLLPRQPFFSFNYFSPSSLFLPFLQSISPSSPALLFLKDGWMQASLTSLWSCPNFSSSSGHEGLRAHGLGIFQSPTHPSPGQSAQPARTSRPHFIIHIFM